MTEDEKVVDFMVEIAWKGIEDIKDSTSQIEGKAYSLMTFSGVLMTIIGGIIVSPFKDISFIIQGLLVFDIFMLLTSVFYAFKTIKLEKQELLGITKTFNELNLQDVVQAKGDFSVSIGKWQERAKKIAEIKSASLSKSMSWFIKALIFIIVIAIFAIIISITNRLDLMKLLGLFEDILLLVSL